MIWKYFHFLYNQKNYLFNISLILYQFLKHKKILVGKFFSVIINNYFNRSNLVFFVFLLIFKIF